LFSASDLLMGTEEVSPACIAVFVLSSIFNDVSAAVDFLTKGFYG
jgi:hypothetical protein